MRLDSAPAAADGDRHPRNRRQMRFDFSNSASSSLFFSDWEVPAFSVEPGWDEMLTCSDAVSLCGKDGWGAIAVLSCRTVELSVEAKRCALLAGEPAAAGFESADCRI